MTGEVGQGGGLWGFPGVGVGLWGFVCLSRLSVFVAEVSLVFLCGLLMFVGEGWGLSSIRI